MNSGVTLTLDDKITLVGRNLNTSSLVVVNNGGTLIMNDGSKISENTAPYAANVPAGIYVHARGIFTMNGGEISENSNSDIGLGAGGGVLVEGYFTMNNGKISGNTSHNHGGILITASGVFIMHGGEISGNTGTGGGVGNSGSFTMDGGKINDNTGSLAGGVFTGGSFIMSGGEISGNTGSGIYNDGSFIMHGGEISGNTGTGMNAGGVSSVYGNFTMDGGEISGNIGYLAGGVRVGDTGRFIKTSSGGVIYGDTNTTHTAGSNENTATSGYGHAVNGSSNSKVRNSTVNAEDAMDSSVSGPAGGWE